MTTSVPLSDQQRKYTRRVHSVANSLVAAKLLLVLADAGLYGKAISCFFPIICLLEELILAECTDKRLSPMREVLQRVSRREPLARDLKFYLGEDWEQQVCRTPAVEEYLEILRGVAQKNPLLLTAYFYGMYVGFTAGGQIISQQARQNMNLPDGEGTSFFTYDDGTQETKKIIKGAFDDLGAALSEDEISLWLEESITMFKLNNKVINSFPLTAKGTLAAIRTCASRCAQSLFVLISVLVAILAVVYLKFFK